ncbi:carbohydrate ABC transporter permease [Propionivibrio soli]|uniref:carbohydrate ABC transporter permease n=1 Tax=Propionivibrio soli TaxID=2976531 RepID=UPI0021E813B9|nr:carbohydrate ABC transporter permease [Propionivibrio soli]
MNSKIIGRIGIYAFLAVSTAFFLIPVYIMVTTSLKGMPEIREGNIFALPLDPNFSAWFKAWSSACIGMACDGIRGGFGNSLKIMVPSVILSVALSSLNGYALALWNVRRAELMLGLLMAGAFIPYQVLLYPLVIMTRTLGIYGTLPGIIAIHVLFGLPVLTLIFRNFYASLPTEIMKAARVDGAGFMQIYWRIMLPMSPSILVVAVILQVTGIWNDYLLGLIFAGRDNLPMTAQLNNLVNSTFGEKEYNVNMAATILTAATPLLVYLASGRYFVRGITSGAVKG